MGAHILKNIQNFLAPGLRCESEQVIKAKRHAKKRGMDHSSAERRVCILYMRLIFRTYVRTSATAPRIRIVIQM